MKVTSNVRKPGKLRLLYDRSFLDAVPQATQGERRPLVNLKANHPWLIQKLSAWHEELFPQGDSELYPKLRCIDNSGSFTAAFWELLIFRFLAQLKHKTVFNKHVRGKRPDVYWPENDLIGDVISISDPFYDQPENKFIHELEQKINKLPLSIDIYIKSFSFAGSSYRKSSILRWIKSLRVDERDHVYDDGQSRLKVDVKPRRSGAKVKMLGTFSLDSKQLKEITKRRIQSKLKKYHGQLIIFACSGQGLFHLDEDTLHMALYGDWQVIFSRVRNARH